MTGKLLLGILICFVFGEGRIDIALAGEPPVIRDFATTEVPTPGGLEISADYLLMNDAVDLFDFREKEASAAALASAPALGDLQGGKVMANLGLFPGTGLHASYGRIDLEAGPVDFLIDFWELSLRRQLWSQDWAGKIAGSLDLGGRYHRAGDRAIGRAADIDSFVKRIDPDLSVQENSTHLIISDGDFLLQAVKEGRPPLQVSLEDLQDYTVFARLTLGRLFDAGSLHVFSELGRSDIDSTVDSNLEVFIPDSLQGAVEDFPIDLDRREYYWKAGSNLQLQLPFGMIGNFRYDYIRIDRDENLDFVDYNHVVKGDLTWPVNEIVALNLGATYLRRQFNGVIPFMYNRFTQSTFDHNYGFIHMGVMARFF